jgi:hypothetical protein
VVLICPILGGIGFINMSLISSGFDHALVNFSIKAARSSFCSIDKGACGIIVG